MVEFDPIAFIKILSELKITPHQFIFCWFIETKDIKSLKLYTEQVQKIRKEEIEDLIQRSYIITTNKDDYDIRNLVITPLFSQNILIDNDTAFEEVLQTLPERMIVKDKTYFTRTGDINEQSFLYGKYIKNNKQKHEEVVRKTKIYTKKVNAGEIGAVGSEKFFKNRLWELISNDDETLRSTLFSTEL